MNLTKAKKHAKMHAPGVTLKRAAGGDIVVYYKGEGEDSPAAYFTNCPRDAYDSAVAMQRILPRSVLQRGVLWRKIKNALG
jgi:hypothetical protein